MTPRLAWYGDDFTGAAAVMEVLASGGIQAVLFLAPPAPALARRFAGAQAVGLAGTARARGPRWMDAHLPAVFDWLAETGAPLLHYKICSTLDSAPHLGSIGRAVEIGLARLGGIVPCLVAAPSMGRHQCYGTLFATGPDGRVHRLDRHPVASRHPTTPMDEADVARHLARQTALPVSLVDLDALHDPDALRQRVLDGARIVFLDAQREADMAPCGRLIVESGARLVLGSQGVEMALLAHWQGSGGLGLPSAITLIGPSRLAIVSGSASAVTATQIARAEAARFACVPVDPAALAEGGAAAGTAVTEAVARATKAATSGSDPLVYTTHGQDDPAFERGRARIAALGIGDAEASARIGAGLGDVLHGILAATGLRRAVIAGGDTSSHATPRLGISALTALAPVAPGASVCLGHGEGVGDGLQIALKGGQMGPPDIFERIRAGG